VPPGARHRPAPPAASSCSAVSGLAKACRNCWRRSARTALRARRWQATLAGDGEVEGTRRQRAAELGLADRDRALPGWIDAAQATDLLAAADILVLASHAENMPLSVLEALAHGVAVVATPVGTTPEILAGRGLGRCWCRPGDAAALAEALARLIDDPDLRQRIATAGHDVFRRHLDIAGAADRLAALYRAHAPALRQTGR
jgi:glycosyltransferase involved in cell wall biosynthesis